MEMLQEYVVVMVVAICSAIGYILKNFVPMDNKYIPLVMGVLGVVLNVWINGFIFSPEILLGGLASGLASTGVYEMVKNMTTKE